MSLPIALGIYFICWWLVFFMVLPIGNHVSPGRVAEEQGFAESAPDKPRLWLKACIATVASAILFAAVYAVIHYRLIPVESIFPSI